MTIKTPPNPYQATWVSHSSLSDYLACPRAYFLKNVYKNSSGRKIQIVSPALSLGSAVHEVLEALAKLPVSDRFKENLIGRYDDIWERKFTGKKGGFDHPERELEYKKRGEEMLRRVIQNPGPIAEKAVRIKAEMDLPRYYLSEEENIILCGKIDWLRYIPEENAVEIIDFKTSRHEEPPSSWQLPIYLLLVQHTQKYAVKKMSYWYLGLKNELTELSLPDPVVAEKEILALARKVKLARSLKKFDCPEGIGGCQACRSFERVLAGEGEFLGTVDGRDMYYLPWRREVKNGDLFDSETETEEIL